MVGIKLTGATSITQKLDNRQPERIRGKLRNSEATVKMLTQLIIELQDVVNLLQEVASF